MKAIERVKNLAESEELRELIRNHNKLVDRINELTEIIKQLAKNEQAESE